MRVFAVLGVSKSGKTTTIEAIIRELRRRRYTVGTVKDIHFEAFAIDGPGTNTNRHRAAGASLVTARGLGETDVLFPARLPVEQILRFYDQDFVILEGAADANVPRIITAHSLAEVAERRDPRAFAVSGVIAAGAREVEGLPAFDARTDVAALVDLIEAKVGRILPNVPVECCGHCGSSCEELLAAILRGERSREDCRLDTAEVELRIDGEKVKIVPFVQDLLRDTLTGLVGNLEGYRRNGRIEISYRAKEPDGR